jgi:hypothetical protein
VDERIVGERVTDVGRELHAKLQGRALDDGTDLEAHRDASF